MRTPGKIWWFGLALAAAVVLAACGVRRAQLGALRQLNQAPLILPEAEVMRIKPSQQFPGNAAEGFDYLRYGNYVSAGIPLPFFNQFYGRGDGNQLRRKGAAENLPAQFNYIEVNGQKMVAPNCFTCHAQQWGDSLYLGMGNTLLDFSTRNGPALSAVHKLFSLNGTYKKYPDFKELMLKGMSFGPQLTTLGPGVNVADKLTMLLLSQRNPETFEWRKDSVFFEYPQALIPVDVPAWWHLKKKNAMFFNGYGRGDFRKFLMGSNLLTVRNTTEAQEVFTHFDDVLAYLYTIEPPQFPGEVNATLATKGQQVFTTHCAKCHGSYEGEETYPNKLIPSHIVRTDSVLWKTNFLYPGYINWFNNSWFANYDNQPARLIPFKGYLAPPLDGVWATAPYFHNGSVPTLEGVLNSQARPALWKRNIWTADYDFQRPGWAHKVVTKGGKGVYDTRIPGYGNGGHYFGDKLSEAERQAVLEYLKTL